MQLSTNCNNSTIFKQLPTIISDINKLGEASNKLKAIDFLIVGLNEGNIDYYRKAISGISKEQATLLLSTKGLNQAQIDLVLSNEAVTASEIAEAATLDGVTKKKNILTVEQQKQLLSSKAITTEKLAEISATLGLETAENGSLISKKALNSEMVKQQLESIGIVGSTQTQIMSMLGLTTAEAGAATASNVLSGAMTKLNIAMSANPIGAIITVIGIAIAGVYGLSKAFDALTDSAEEIDERVDGLIDKYNELKTTADNNASIVESLADEYEELSKGVNNLGENISLTSEEYDRYNDIVNQIADMFPTLITGYTDEGTAILSLKGNVEQLRDAYKEAQQEAYNLLVATGKDSDGNDIMESYKNLSELDFWDSDHVLFGGEDVTTTVKRDITKQILDMMSDMNTAVEEYDKFAKEIFDTYGDRGYNFLEEMGLPAIKDVFTDTTGITKDALIAGRATVQSYYQGFQSEIDTKLSRVRLMANAFLNTNDFYLDDSTNDELKNALSVMVNSLDEELANSFNGEKEKVGSYVNNIVNGIKDNEDAQKALTKLFTMDTTDMSVGEIQSEVDSYMSIIADAIHKDSDKLKIRLGFEDVDTQTLINNVKGKLKGTEFDEKVRELNLGDLQIAAEQVDVPLDSIESWEELLELIEKVKSETFNNETDNLTPTISSSISQLATQLEPQFAELGEAYKAIFTDEGFTLDDVDNQMLEKLRQSFAEIEEEVGVAFDATKLDPFFDTLTNGNSTAEQVQQAFNDLATAYFYSTDTLEQLNAETADAIEKQLEEMGVVNAQTVVADALAAKTEELIVQKEYLAQTGKQLSDASNEEVTAFILEQIEAGNCGESLALLQLKKLLVNSTQINTAADIQQIMNLASAAGMGAEVLTQLANAKSILSTVENGGTVSMTSYNKALADVENAKQTMLDWKPIELDFNNVGGGASSAGSAGGEAGDQYVKAFEEELSHLTDLRDRGIIDESEYLSRLRELYQRYFKDRKEYLDEYNKYERQYLEGKYTCPLLQ